MTKREAKRLACFTAARALENAMDGWVRITGDDGKVLPSDGPDERRVLASLRELVDELERRGWMPDDHA